MKNYMKKEFDLEGNVYYFNSKGHWHRTDGPAVEWADGGKSWWVNGRRHRLDGPAFGSNSWYIKGMFYSKSCHNRLYLFSVLEPRRIDINSTEEN